MHLLLRNGKLKKKEGDAIDLNKQGFSNYQI